MIIAGTYAQLSIPGFLGQMQCSCNNPAALIQFWSITGTQQSTLAKPQHGCAPQLSAGGFQHYSKPTVVSPCAIHCLTSAQESHQ